MYKKRTNLSRISW